MKPRTSLRRACSLRAAAFASVLCVCSVVEVAAQKKAAAAAPKEQAQSARAARARVPDDVLLRVVRAEDERRWEDADLRALLADERAAVRAHERGEVGRAEGRERAQEVGHGERGRLRVVHDRAQRDLRVGL